MSLARRAGGRVLTARAEPPPRVAAARPAPPLEVARGPLAAAFVPLAAAAARLRVLFLASATGTPSRGYAEFLGQARVERPVRIVT
jgi:hypothetical protein